MPKRARGAIYLLTAATKGSPMDGRKPPDCLFLDFLDLRCCDCNRLFVLFFRRLPPMIGRIIFRFGIDVRHLPASAAGCSNGAPTYLAGIFTDIPLLRFHIKFDYLKCPFQTLKHGRRI